jgi:hypothetical protein
MKDVGAAIHPTFSDQDDIGTRPCVALARASQMTPSGASAGKRARTHPFSCLVSV